ncbi:MAG TPA: aspartate ammonia-lyase, partial [Mycobacterium sp.]
MAADSVVVNAEEAAYRIEHDTMGEVRVPINALWRAQTQRAVENFPISGRGLERTQIRALGLLKGACA